MLLLLQKEAKAVKSFICLKTAASVVFLLISQFVCQKGSGPAKICDDEPN